jgi:hypothetical protein
MLNFCLNVCGVYESVSDLLRPNLARDGVWHTLTTPFVNPFQLIVLQYTRDVRFWGGTRVSWWCYSRSRQSQGEQRGEKSGRFSWWVLSLSLLDHDVGTAAKPHSHK